MNLFVLIVFISDVWPACKETQNTRTSPVSYVVYEKHEVWLFLFWSLKDVMFMHAPESHDTWRESAESALTLIEPKPV